MDELMADIVVGVAFKEFVSELWILRMGIFKVCAKEIAKNTTSHASQHFIAEIIKLFFKYHPNAPK